MSSEQLCCTSVLVASRYSTAPLPSVHGPRAAPGPRSPVRTRGASTRSRLACSDSEARFSNPTFKSFHRWFHKCVDGETCK